MAGIGFQLRKVLNKDSILSMGKVYIYSAMLSSGPWVISILAILFIGFVNVMTLTVKGNVVQFQVIITYVIALASSLVVTGFVQLPYTRYVADRIFDHQEDEVLPSFYGVLLIVWFFGFLFILPFTIFVFPEHTVVFHLGVISTFMALSGVWISNILAASLKYYRAVIVAYAVAYGLIVVLSNFFGNSPERLIMVFFVGNALLLTILISLISKSYASKRLISFRFFQEKKFYWSLGIAGLFYNLGIWVDKFIFWYHPLTGYTVLGHIKASVVYDLPIFISYLSILPGMAIFFFRLEVDFAEKYELYYDAVRNGATLDLIRRYRNNMSEVVRHAIREIIMVQSIMNALLFVMAPSIFASLNIPQLYLGLFHVLTIGAQLQLGFMSVLALLYYLDRRRVAMWLSILFFTLNGSFTLLSIKLGPAMFGYGYAISLLISFTLSLFIIKRELWELNYETFMLH